MIGLLPGHGLLGGAMAEWAGPRLLGGDTAYWAAMAKWAGTCSGGKTCRFGMYSGDGYPEAAWCSDGPWRGWGMLCFHKVPNHRQSGGGVNVFVCLTGSSLVLALSRVMRIELARHL